VDKYVQKRLNLPIRSDIFDLLAVKALQIHLPLPQINLTEPSV